jgi:hypothetical protein
MQSFEIIESALAVGDASGSGSRIWNFDGETVAARCFIG